VYISLEAAFLEKSYFGEQTAIKGGQFFKLLLVEIEIQFTELSSILRKHSISIR
jgi:hypothetical protein